MKTLVVIAATLFVGAFANATQHGEMKACEADVAKHCAAAKDDHAKHDCLVKAGAAVSPACHASLTADADHADAKAAKPAKKAH